MPYFSKITHTYTGKNRLQEAALTVLRSLDCQQVESPDELKAFVEERITRCNRSYPRCTALVVSLQKSYRDDGSRSLHVSDLVTLTLYEVKGHFSYDAQMADLRPTSSVGPSGGNGPQLTLFVPSMPTNNGVLGEPV